MTETLREACERAQAERLQLPWMPLASDFLTNGKTLHLKGKLKDRTAPFYVLNLLQWSWLNRQSGRFLASEAAFVVEEACEWRGEHGALFVALMESRWVEQDGDCVVIHGWEERAGKQFLKVFKDRDRKPGSKANQAETQETTNPPRSFRGTSTEVPTHRNRSRNRRKGVFSGASVENEDEADFHPPPPTPSEEKQEGEGIDLERVEALDDARKRGWTPDECRDVADLVWESIQQDKRDHNLPPDIRRPGESKDGRPAFNEWAIRGAEKFGLINLLWASRWFHADDNFSGAGWSTRVFMTEGVYPQRCHPPRERKAVYGL